MYHDPYATSSSFTKKREQMSGGSISSLGLSRRELRKNYKYLVKSLLTEAEKEFLYRCAKKYQRLPYIEIFCQELSQIINSTNKLRLLPYIRTIISEFDKYDYDKFAARLKLRTMEGRTDFTAKSPDVYSLTPSVRSSVPKGRSDIRVIIIPQREENLGFSIRGGSENGLGIFVSEVDIGSTAAESGLEVGDQILEANNISLENAACSSAVRVLTVSDRLKLIIKRVGKIPEWKLAKEKVLWYDIHSGDIIAAPPSDTDPYHISGLDRQGLREKRVAVTTSGNTDFIGFNIRGGNEYGLGIFVSRVDPGGLAEKNGVCAGDQILDVNGRDFNRISHSAAADFLRTNEHLIITLREVGRYPAFKEIFAEYTWSEKSNSLPRRGTIGRQVFRESPVSSPNSTFRSRKARSLNSIYMGPGQLQGDIYLPYDEGILYNHKLEREPPPLAVYKFTERPEEEIEVEIRDEVDASGDEYVSLSTHNTVNATDSRKLKQHERSVYPSTSKSVHNNLRVNEYPREMIAEKQFTQNHYEHAHTSPNTSISVTNHMESPVSQNHTMHQNHHWEEATHTMRDDRRLVTTAIPYESHRETHSVREPVSTMPIVHESRTHSMREDRPVVTTPIVYESRRENHSMREPVVTKPIVHESRTHSMREDRPVVTKPIVHESRTHSMREDRPVVTTPNVHESRTHSMRENRPPTVTHVTQETRRDEQAHMTHDHSVEEYVIPKHKLPPLKSEHVTKTRQTRSFQHQNGVDVPDDTVIVTEVDVTHSEPVYSKVNKLKKTNSQSNKSSPSKSQPDQGETIIINRNEVAKVNQIDDQILMLEHRKAELSNREIAQINKGKESDSTDKKGTWSKIKTRLKDSITLTPPDSPEPDMNSHHPTFQTQMSVDPHKLTTLEERSKELLSHHEHQEVMDLVNAYHQMKDLDHLVQNVLKILRTPEKMLLLKDVRGIIYQYHIARYDNMVNYYEIEKYEDMSTKLHLPLRHNEAQPKKQLMTTVLDENGHFHIRTVNQHEKDMKTKGKVLSTMRTGSIDMPPHEPKKPVPPTANQIQWVKLNHVEDHNKRNSIRQIFNNIDDIPDPRSTVTLIPKQKPNLGLQLRGGRVGQVTLPIRIDEIAADSAAADVDQLKAGIIIVSVEGNKVLRSTCQEVNEILQREYADMSKDMLRLEVKEDKELRV